VTIEPSPESTFNATDTLPTGAAAVGAIVDRLATRMTEQQIATALDLGHVAAFGVSPSEARMSVAWAMVCHETGRGEKGLYNYNLGNVDAAQGWTGDRFSLTANEGSGATVHAQTKYLRAYPDAYSGAAGWWQYLAEHHATALALFDSGDGDAAGAALKRSGYYTGIEAAYQRELRLMAAEYLAKRRDGRL
jgi:hypothetical protein